MPERIPSHLQNFPPQQLDTLLLVPVNRKAIDVLLLEETVEVDASAHFARFGCFSAVLLDLLEGEIER